MKQITRAFVDTARKALNVTSRFPLHTRKALCMSTAHLTMKTDVALHDYESDDPTSLHNQLSYHPMDHGWLFYVTEHQAGLALPGHDELERLLELAFQLGYDFLIFDGDAEILPEEIGLPTFVW